LLKDGEQMASNVLYFEPVKELELPRPKIEYKIEENEEAYVISLQSDLLAKNVFLSIGSENGFFSDNYFDLLPNETVEIHLQTTLSLEKLKKVLRFQTLDTTY